MNDNMKTKQYDTLGRMLSQVEALRSQVDSVARSLCSASVEIDANNKVLSHERFYDLMHDVEGRLETLEADSAGIRLWIGDILDEISGE